MDDRYGNEVDLDSIEDEKTLIELLEETDDFDEKKMIRARLREVQTASRGKRDDIMKRRENDREDAIKRRQREAEEQKKRTLAMYDSMAKSAPAGGSKVMDINIYKNATPSAGNQMPLSTGTIKRDLVEETIRDRVKASDTRKMRILAAYDSAAKSGPAGSIRDVNFDEFKHADVSDFVPPKPEGSCTFGSLGGIPKVVKPSASRPGTPGSPGFKGSPFAKEEVYLDPVERALRQRVKESEDNKRRLLAAYDYVAKSGGAGPKVVSLQELRDFQVPEDYEVGSKHSATAGFKGGIARKIGDNPNYVNPKSGPAAAYHDGQFRRK